MKKVEPVSWFTSITFSALIIVIFTLVLLGMGIWIGLRIAVGAIAILSILIHRHVYGGKNENVTASPNLAGQTEPRTDWREN